jgi:hypothetical protein
MNSDDDEQLNSSSTLMPNSSVASDRSKFLQTSSKESSIDSTDTNPYDNAALQQQNAGSATPARSLISDYDNLHGSFGSLNDDTQQQQPPPPPPPPSSSEVIPIMAASSMSTIYESLDNIPSSSTPTYATAMSTMNNDNTSNSTTSAKRINSDISDEDLVEALDIETPTLTSTNPFRSSKGRFASHHTEIIKARIYLYVFLACLHLPCFVFSLVRMGMAIPMLHYKFFLFFKLHNNKRNIYLYTYIYHSINTFDRNN